MDWGLLAGLSDDERRAVLALANRRRYKKGDIVFHEGDPGETLHLIDRGRVAVRLTTPLGDVATVAVLGAGEFFGEMAVIAPAPRNATVVALEATETLTLHREALNELRAERPSIDRFLMDALVEEVRRITHQLLEALYVPVDKRVLRRLVDLAEIYRAGDETVTVPLTQEDLAQMAGTTRPSANKVLRAAEEAGAVLISRGKIEVLDRELLAKRAR